MIDEIEDREEVEFEDCEEAEDCSRGGEGHGLIGLGLLA